MRKFLLVAGAAVCVFGSAAFAATGPYQGQGQSAAAVPGTYRGAILLAQNGPPVNPPGKSGDNGNNNGNNGKSGKPECDTVSPSHPCMGNNGFGNGGNDGSPNGMQDKTR